MHISESKRCYNVIPSVYYFYVKTKMLADFQICISVSSIFLTFVSLFSFIVYLVRFNNLTTYICFTLLKAKEKNLFITTNNLNNLKVQSCKLYSNKYMIASTEITNNDIFAFIAVLVFKLLNSKVLFINRKDNGNR